MSTPEIIQQKNNINAIGDIIAVNIAGNIMAGWRVKDENVMQIIYVKNYQG
jgi:hypothetical protein